MRVPFLVSWPRRIQPSVVHRPVSSLDVMPTAAALAGVGAPARAEDRSLLTALNVTAPHRTLFWRMGPDHAIRDGDWKLVVVNRSATADDLDKVLGHPIPDGIKAEVSPLGQWRLLFNLRSDPSEKHDVAAEHADVAARLEQQFKAWDRGNVQPMFTSRRVFRTEVDGRKVQLFN